jgi:hypothetical protein
MIESEQFEVSLYFLCMRIRIITNKLILMSNLFLPLAKVKTETGRVNHHPQSGRIQFGRRFMADEFKSMSVRSTLNLHPGA